MLVLAVNCGSSSLKFSLLDATGARTVPIVVGAVEDLGQPRPRLWLEDARGQRLVETSCPKATAHADAVREAAARLEAAGLPPPEAIGHRVVFGGRRYVEPIRLEAAVLDELRALIPFAPLHLPAELAGIEAAREMWREAAHVACFDTAFHATLPARAKRLPLPQRFWDAGIQRYGFHGLSYEYVVESLGSELLGRAVIAHLGHGASLAAVADGACIDTTMGLTPAGGLMMSTRSGDLDPGVMVHLARVHGLDPDAIDTLVNRESGLAGVSGVSGDMKTLLAMQASHHEARLAVEMYCYRVRLGIGAYAAALGGLDTLVFTGGVGEGASRIRRDICAGLAHLGVAVDEQANSDGSNVISAAGRRPVVRVVRTNENVVVARATARLLMQKGLP